MQQISQFFADFSPAEAQQVVEINPPIDTRNKEYAALAGAHQLDAASEAKVPARQHHDRIGLHWVVLAWGRDDEPDKTHQQQRSCGRPRYSRRLQDPRSPTPGRPARARRKIPSGLPSQQSQFRQTNLQPQPKITPERPEGWPAVFVLSPSR